VISRALAEIFAHPLLRSSLPFRGGTALYKLYIAPPARYSEDIDLVQVNAEPIGPVMDANRYDGSWSSTSSCALSGKLSTKQSQQCKFCIGDRPRS
jgi:hypothetical protein